MDQYSSSAQIRLIKKGFNEHHTDMQKVEFKPLNAIWHALLIYALGASSYLCMIPGPRELGFFCGDESIRLPYKSSTIPMPLLHTTFYVILIPLLISVEYCCTKYIYPRYSSKLPTVYECYGRLISPTIVRVCKFFLISQLGSMINIFVLNITKYSTGRLRPHFLAVCRPSVNTSTIQACGDAATYVEHYICLGKDTAKITEARLSFFSGHTSNAFYYAMFFLLYLHSRVGRTYRTSVAFPVLYTLLLSLAAVVGYSRIADNKHHVIDVLAGAVEGSITAMLMVLVLFRHQFFDVSFTPHSIPSIQVKDKTASESSSETDSATNVHLETNSNITRTTVVEMTPVTTAENEVIEIPLNDEEDAMPPPPPTSVSEDKLPEVVIRPKILTRTESHV